MDSGYIGSPSIQTSTAGQEIVSLNDEKKRYKFREFSFLNDQACSVRINGGEPIYLREKQGFSSSQGLYKVQSFIIVESGILFNYVGAY